MNLVNFTKTLIVCSKCKMTAKKLFFQTSFKGHRTHQGTPIGFCENCNRYEIPMEIIS